MEIIKEGIKYSIPGQIKELNQTITFIHVDEETKKFNDGATTEEVLKVIIDRLKTQNTKNRSYETNQAIMRCEEALLWLIKRNKTKLENKYKKKVAERQLKETVDEFIPKVEKESEDLKW
jgi:hypothetical protein